MLTFSVVPRLNIFKDNKRSLLPVSEFMLIYTFRLECLEKTFSDSIILEISFSIHASYDEWIFFHHRAELMTCIRYAAIRMEY